MLLLDTSVGGGGEGLLKGSAIFSQTKARTALSSSNKIPKTFATEMPSVVRLNFSVDIVKAIRDLKRT